MSGRKESQIWANILHECRIDFKDSKWLKKRGDWQINKNNKNNNTINTFMTLNKVSNTRGTLQMLQCMTVHFYSLNVY